MLLDVRLYRLHTGRRTEFDALVRNETLPMARRYGHRIVDFGPSVHDEDSYFLIRAFSSAEDRKRSLANLYESEEWLRTYDARVMALIDSYQAAVFPTSSDAVRELTEASQAADLET